MATSSISNLPTARYIAICNRSNSKYLTLLKDGLLTFSASEKVRLAVHEVVYKTGLPDDVVLLRCANGRFWRLSESDSSIRADWEGIPAVSDTACHFTTVVVREGVIAFRSVRNGQYAKRYTGVYPDSYSAVINSLDQYCEVQVSAANDNALTLPRYLTFKGDNDKFMANYSESGHYWQKFHKSSADLSCIYEVAPLLDGSVSLKSIDVNRFFRLSPNWIWADSTSPTSNVECHFEPVKLSNTMLALKSMVNNQFVRRHTDYWKDCLCAVGTSVNDASTHLTMREAVNKRTLSNIRYLLDFAEISDIELIMVGEGALQNTTPNSADLQVTVILKQSVTESQSWSNSVTVSLEVMTEFTVGVPFVASVSGEITVGSSYTHTSEFGSTTENSLEFQTLFTVPQVPPGRTARVKVQCQKAKCRVPFTYTMKDTRIDGVDFPTEDRIDGICEAANVFDVKGIASWDDARGVTTEITLPVDVTRGDPHPRSQK
ncbi:unnamed protein product [Sphagnum jensenii]|uniref:Agglutinin domain-containing protein n=1 Tax=Sphagnum jensenii TaxID=128206 RepID=A0ABP1AQN5_9BRYO